jgi:hypothetical protein
VLLGAPNKLENIPPPVLGFSFPCEEAAELIFACYYFNSSSFFYFSASIYLLYAIA